VSTNLKIQSDFYPAVARADRPTGGPVASLRGRSRASAFSLLEIMIAIGVLGIGLIMVAAIFPVALTQHKESIEKSRSLDLLNKAEALLRSRIDASRLWAAAVVQPGADSPWYMLPMSNLQVGSNGANAWDRMPALTPIFSPIELSTLPERGVYANCLNFAITGDPGNLFSLTSMPSLEQLSDRKSPNLDSLSPMTDAEFESIENRFAWVGFYRRMASGSTRYTVAVNRVLRGERYAEQDVTTVGAAYPGLSPQAVDPFNVRGRRLPVPWRVTVAFNPITRRIYSVGSPEGLGELAPPGSRMMVGGFVWRNTLVAGVQPSMPIPPAGRILTVTNVFDNTSDGIDNPETVDVLEDTTGLPEFGASPNDYYFDVIVFPPPAVGQQNNGSVQFGRKSPLVQWKVNL